MRCLISNKSSQSFNVHSPGTEYVSGRSVAPACEKVTSAFVRSLITPAVRKLMSDTPVPGRPSNLRPKGLRQCEFMFTNWAKIEEFQ